MFLKFLTHTKPGLSSQKQKSRFEPAPYQISVLLVIALGIETSRRHFLLSPPIDRVLAMGSCQLQGF